ncbi:50S ribosomal protein L11 methyltransferase [Luteolibacter marinus]|uniref:50S ribosomal protein L11 methyltransferase n=1 Tax=Luteolibacter marinus TaxID=2776705 RepID=UPI001865F361|nr:50S ribosomal protein L11 methyltransferase [Luteolibacter marinus]
MFVWSKLSAAKWLDAWEDRFRGNPNFVMHVLKGGKSVRVEVFCDTRKAADAIAEQFGGSVRKLSADWKNATPTVSPPLKVRDKFIVTQHAAPKDLAKLAKEFPGREILSIPPEMAFGTGDHATTSTCLRFLADIARDRPAGWSCADLGCGTGVLAIAARKLGSGDTFACDFDPFAVSVAERNFTRNHVEGIVTQELDVLKWKPRKKYDVVVANIFSTVLIQAFPVISKIVKPGGDLVLSGILASQAWDVFTAAASHGFGFPEVVKKGKWVTARGGWMNDLTAKS